MGMAKLSWNLGLYALGMEELTNPMEGVIPRPPKCYNHNIERYCYSQHLDTTLIIFKMAESHNNLIVLDYSFLFNVIINGMNYPCDYIVNCDEYHLVTTCLMVYIQNMPSLSSQSQSQIVRSKSSLRINMKGKEKILGGLLLFCN